ncbi:tetratricopeptide repeat protein [Sphingomonas sp. CL5.1]|uniref:tetratricopeptide repeat protein n=1 Tax=Sphingomonas sp. CL5.1 TaxID=2653203 RepID=UPI0015835381|nr:tetratricopeptide repeat protein [Sphingomonas sp. CL5.1]QKR99431.1 tetratricopeptide repeat protein [Sphingomonas sp. CL5.1]
MKKRSIPFLVPLVAAGLLAGCTSSDRKAANDAAIAQGALERGQITVARQYIQRALALRDDISDYWLIKAHIALAAQDLSGAYDAYQNVIQLDRANVEALTGLCQIAIAGNIAGQAEKYADQLAALNPSDVLPNTVRAAAAASRGDRDKANHFLDLVFAVQPGDPIALMVKARLLADAQDYAGAAKVMERATAAPGNPTGRLSILTGYYKRAGDRDGLFRAVERLAQANPKDPDIQFQYADLLFDRGNADAANAAIARAVDGGASDIAVAGRALNLWLKQGSGAIAADRLLSDAANAPLAMKAAYAQFANETGRPDLAIRLLQGEKLDAGAMQRPDAANAAAALAYARGLRGDRAGADAMLANVLQADPDQPGALLARGRLRAAAGDRRGAIEDVRNAVAQDGSNVAARLTLADLLLQDGQRVLAETALRDGMNAADDDPRLPARLARLLIAEGRRDEAAATLSDFAKANPLSQRAAKVRPG